jgi:hypothetical protein
MAKYWASTGGAMRRVVIIAVAVAIAFGMGGTGKAHATEKLNVAGLFARAEAAVKQLRAASHGESVQTHSLAEPTLTLSDPTGDEEPSAIGAADITAAGYNGTASSVAFATRVADPVDPATDPTWTTGIGAVEWAIDGNFDGVVDRLAIMTNNGSGDVVAGLVDESDDMLRCMGTATYLGNHDYQATFATSCMNGISQFMWAAAVIYVPDPEGDTMAEDVAPDTHFAGPQRTVPGQPLNGYWMMGGDGLVYGFGSSASVPGRVPAATGFANRKDGTGYFITDWVGHVFTRGRARYRGGTPALRPGEAITTMAATPTDNGYWLFSNFGRVFPFGDAHSFGDLSHQTLNRPIIASVATPSGNGYYMVGADGGIFTFGDAHFRGSKGGQPLNAPIVGIAPTPDNLGYWLVGGDGGVFTFGDATFRGSMGGRHLNAPVVGLVAYGNGYLMVAADGGVFTFSNKHFLGSLGGHSLPAPIKDIAAFSLA